MQQEVYVRFGIFIGAFALLTLLETYFPARERKMQRKKRWGGAFTLLICGIALTRLILPTGLAGIALWVEAKHWGLLYLLDLPIWMACLLGFILLDLAIWLQHRLMHINPFLWRMHRVHHSDPDLDVSSALRFHPFEIFVSIIWKSMATILIGAPVLIVFWFEVILNASAMFNHANWRLSSGWDKALRFLLVTPAMHRLHHSAMAGEHNRNYGFCLSIWDKLFRCYAKGEVGEDEQITLGWDGFMCIKAQSAPALLVQPAKHEADQCNR